MEKSFFVFAATKEGFIEKVKKATKLLNNLSVDRTYNPNLRFLDKKEMTMLCNAITKDIEKEHCKCVSEANKLFANEYTGVLIIDIDSVPQFIFSYFHDEMKDISELWGVNHNEKWNYHQLKLFKLRKMFRDVGFEPKLKSNPSLKVFKQSSFRKKRLYLTQKYSICFLKTAINND